MELARLLVMLITPLILYEHKSDIDAVVSSLKQTKEQSAKWHNSAWFYIAIVSLTVAFLYSGLTLVSIIVAAYYSFARMCYFPVRLNMKRGKPLFYLGSGKWDKIFKKHEKGYFILTSLITVTLIGLLIVAAI